MTDTWTKERRSEVMRRIRSTNTKPEMIFRSALHRLGFRFRIHRKDLPGRPDIVLPRFRTVIFVNGCFWHQHAGCKDGHAPKSGESYWLVKFSKTVERDKNQQLLLEALGWMVIVVWECEIEADLDGVLQRVIKKMKGD